MPKKKNLKPKKWLETRKKLKLFWEALTMIVIEGITIVVLLIMIMINISVYTETSPFEILADLGRKITSVSMAAQNALRNDPGAIYDTQPKQPHENEVAGKMSKLGQNSNDSCFTRVEAGAAKTVIFPNTSNYTKINNYFKAIKSPLQGYGKVFTDLGKKYQIDADVPVCMISAESSGGKDLTTNYNYANYGNDDGGNRRAYDSVYEGVDIIFWALAYENYQKNNHTIGDLSNGGRIAQGKKTSDEKNVFVWATDAGNWNTTVKKCLSELKGAPVDESYQFRLNK